MNSILHRYWFLRLPNCGIFEVLRKKPLKHRAVQGSHIVVIDTFDINGILGQALALSQLLLDDPQALWVVLAGIGCEDRPVPPLPQSSACFFG